MANLANRGAPLAVIGSTGGVAYDTFRSRRSNRNNQRRRPITATRLLRGRTGARGARGLAGTGVNEQVGRKRRKGRKVAREGRKKRVKISRKFAKKVKQIVKGTQPVGYFSESSCAYAVPLDGAQNCQMVGLSSGYNLATSTPLFFDPVSVLNAASVLWFNKIPGSPIKTALDPDNFPTPSGLKIFVESSRVMITYKNNTANTLTLKLYDMSPKSTMNSDQEANHNPLSVWINELIVQTPPAVAPFTNVGFFNPLGTTPNTLFNSPKYCIGVKHFFSIDCTTVILEPGKTHVHTLPGPSQMMYDYNKFRMGSGVTQLLNCQKFVKMHMVVFYPDLQNTNAGTPGRFTDVPVAPNAYGLLTEVRSFYKLRMPEEAGFTYPTTLPAPGDGVPLTQRSYRFAQKNWNITQTGAILEVSDENPVQAVAATLT